MKNRDTSSRRNAGFFEHLFRDLRYALRQLRLSPGFGITAIAILSFGIGSCVAIFGFVEAALIKPLPYRDPARLVGVYERVALIPRSNLSYLDYLDWKKLNRVFSSFDAWGGSGYLLATASGVQPVNGARVSNGFFRTLGVVPLLGRDFHAGEDSKGARPTVLLSYSGWKKWFGGREDVVGESITLSGVSYSVIGVLPQEFHFAPRGRAEFWTALQPTNPCELRRSCHNLYGVARLRDGVSIEAALSEMTSIAQLLERQYPDSNRGQGAAVVQLSEAIVGDIRPILLMLLSGAGLLLLIACVNVASLLLVRSESRKREIAVRAALGASPARLLGQFLTEGFVLVVSGCAIGLLLAEWMMQLLVSLVPVGMIALMPYLQGLGVNLRVAAFAAAVSLLAEALFATAPLARIRLSEILEGLNEGARGGIVSIWRRFGPNLVVLELAIAMVLLVGAALLGKSFYRLLHVEIGFQPDRLATIQVAAPTSVYPRDEQAVALAREIVDSVGSLPGVQKVAISGRLPLTGNGNTTWFRVQGRPFHGEHNEANSREVSAGFFETLQARMLRGRYFRNDEDASKPGVAIINQSLARQYFPGEDPIGRKIGDTQLSRDSLREIVGVVDDIREGSLEEKIWPAIYIPFSQSPDTYFSLVVRTSQAEQSILPALVATIRGINPDIGTMDESSMNDRIRNSQAAYLRRSSTWLAGGFATLALLLGAVGLYGVIAYSVGHRTREFGVRIALGAQRATIYRLILQQAAWLTVIGIVAGLSGSVIAAALLRNLLFGVEPYDVAVMTSVAGALAVTALLASYIPARRAASLSPMDALRRE